MFYNRNIYLNRRGNIIYLKCETIRRVIMPREYPSEYLHKKFATGVKRVHEISSKQNAQNK